MWPYFIDERIRAFALKRIHKDLQEAHASALPGLSICMPDSQNPYLLHANIKIQDGIYKDILIHVIIRLPENYPHSAPAANIAPGHPFTEDFHEHIIGKSEYGAAICTDLLNQYRKFFDNFTIYGKRIISGWTPAYTLSSILLQLQVFFANHDLPETRRPTPSQIQAMKEKTEKFTLDIMVSEGKSKKIVTHSYDQPYPPFNEQAPQSSLQGRNEELCVELEGQESEYDLSRDEQNEYFDTDFVVQDFRTTTYKTKPQRVHFEEEEKDSMLRAKGKTNFNNNYSPDKHQISNKLICPITRQTIFDEPTPTFGYLMLINQDRFKRLHVIPVIELNSKEGIQHCTRVERLASYSYYHHISTYGNRFNFWMPVYINEKHYEQSQHDIEEAISIIYNRLVRRQAGPESFHPKMVLKVLPPILVKTIIHILKWNVHQSLAALDAYCQFYWLFMKLVNKYPEIQRQIDEEVNMFLTQEEFRHKKKIGDLGEFMFKLSLSSQGIYNTEVNKALLGEFFTRQVTWAKKRNPELRNYSEVENLVPTFLGASKIACQFFLVQFETAKLMVNDSVRAQLEEGYGFVNPALLDKFMEKVYWIRDNMRYNWRTLVDNIGLGHVIRKKEQVEEMIRACFEKESQLYSEWTVIQCKTLYTGLEDPRKLKFGYILNSICQNNLSIQTDLSCDITHRVQNGAYWLPIYINKEHFERLKDTYNTQIMYIRSTIVPFDAEKAQIAECAIKVFTFVLVHCFDNLCSGRRPVQDFIAYVQILWSFWKLLEQNGKMRDCLNEEVELFQRDKLYREDVSWENLPEIAIKFVLSEKGRSDPEVWNCFFEELVRKYTVEAAKIIDGNNYKEPNCSKFGCFKEFPIKYILAQIELARTVLNDQYRVQLENNNGFLKEHDIQDVRSNFLQPMNHDAGDLWSLLLRVLNIKGKVEGFETMSNEIQEKLKQVKKKEQTGEIVVDKLGSQFVVKMDKKKKNKKKQVTE